MGNPRRAERGRLRRRTASSSPPRRSSTSAVIRSDPNRTIIPGLVVDAVCHVPFCAHPSYTQGYYDRDNAFYLEWDRLSAEPARVQAWLDEWVFGLPDRPAYWEKLGAEVHDRLRVEPRWSEPVNYGQY